VCVCVEKERKREQPLVDEHIAIIENDREANKKRIST